MSILEQLIDEHGAAISKIESDFSQIDEEDAFPFEQIYSIYNDERPIINVQVTGTNAYNILDQVQGGMIGQIDQEVVTIPFYEQLFGGSIRLPISGLRNRALITQLLMDERTVMKAKVNQAVCSLLDNAVSTDTIHKGWDGVPLGSNAHPLIAGGHQDNLETTGLSADNFNASYGLMMALKNQSGVPQALTLDGVIVPTQLAATAKTLSRSPFKPGTEHNDANLAYETEVIVCPTLTDANNWFAFNRRAMKKNMHMYYHEPYQIMIEGAKYDSINIDIPTRVVVSWGFLNHEWCIVHDVTP